MPIFGLVWVASWVGCFFPSSQDLLQAPSHSSCVLPVQLLHDAKTPGIFPPTQTAPNQAGWRSASHTSTRIVVKPSSENLLTAFKNLFQVTSISSRPARAVTVTQIKANPNTAPTVSPVKAVGFEQCLPIQGDGGDAPTQKPEQFQVKFKDSVVGEFSSQKQAMRVAQHLERLLSNSTLKASRIQPVLVKGLPAVKWGDRLLFTLNQDPSQRLTCNSELLAIQWANNLRFALDEPELTIAEAQEKMYGLRATSQAIEGTASWYGPYFNGRQTATGETFSEKEFTAAHPSLPFDTYLKVTNLSNGKSVIVRVNDRGPYLDNRTLDLSKEAAHSLDSEETGIIPIEAVIMKPTQGSTAAKTVAQL